MKKKKQVERKQYSLSPFHFISQNSPRTKTTMVFATEFPLTPVVLLLVKVTATTSANDFCSCFAGIGRRRRRRDRSPKRRAKSSVRKLCRNVYPNPNSKYLPGPACPTPKPGTLQKIVCTKSKVVFRVIEARERKMYNNLRRCNGATSGFDGCPGLPGGKFLFFSTFV